MEVAAHERFRRINTKGRWPNQAIDYDVSLMVRASNMTTCKPPTFRSRHTLVALSSRLKA